MLTEEEAGWLVAAHEGNGHMEDVCREVNDRLAAAGRKEWKESTIKTYANGLRKRGVELPKRKRRIRAADADPGVDRLNDLIRRIQHGEKVEVQPLQPAPPRPAPAIDPRPSVLGVVEQLKREQEARRPGTG